MAFHKITARGPVPRLKRGEYLVCQACQTTYLPADFPSLWNVRLGRAQCPTCKAFEQFVLARTRPSKALADRWGKAVIDKSWTGIPNLLIHGQRLLSLDASDFVLLVHLESFRRDGDAAVWPRVATLVDRSGLSERTIRTHVAGLERRGLIEVQTALRQNGSYSSNRYTANGLREALQLIARNVDNGDDPGSDLDVLLARLAKRGAQASTARIA